MRRRVVLAGAGLWLAVVAATSGVTWLMIERVGDVVTSSGAPDPVVPQELAPLPSAGPSSTATVSPSPRASRVPKARPSGSPTRPPFVRPSLPPGLRPSLPPVLRPSVPAPTPRSVPSTRPSSGDGGAGGDASSGAPAPRSTSRTWSGSSGRVTVTCTGSRVGLQSASPANGWRVEVGSRAGEEVEVTFRQSAGGGEVQVQARCSGGTPAFGAESDGGSGGRSGGRSGD